MLFLLYSFILFCSDEDIDRKGYVTQAPHRPTPRKWIDPLGVTTPRRDSRTISKEIINDLMTSKCNWS